MHRDRKRWILLNLYINKNTLAGVEKCQFVHELWFCGSRLLSEVGFEKMEILARRILESSGKFEKFGGNLLKFKKSILQTQRQFNRIFLFINSLIHIKWFKYFYVLYFYSISNFSSTFRAFPIFFSAFQKGFSICLRTTNIFPYFRK